MCNSCEDLVDIRQIHIDTSLPRQERIASFINQLKNPYLFRCGDFVIEASFANNGASMEDRLKGILRT